MCLRNSSMIPEVSMKLNGCIDSVRSMADGPKKKPLAGNDDGNDDRIGEGYEMTMASTRDDLIQRQ